MKNIIKKIKKILTYDISNIFYNIIYSSNQKIYDLIQRFFIFIDLSSYLKTKIFVFLYIISYVPLMDYTAKLMNGGGNGFDMEYRYFLFQYKEDEKITTKETMANNIIKLKYQYTGSLYSCNINYEQTVEDLKNNFPILLTNVVKECTQNSKVYSYEIIAEAPLSYKVIYKIESIIKTIPYSLLGIVFFGGTIILSPLLILTDN